MEQKAARPSRPAEKSKSASAKVGGKKAPAANPGQPRQVPRPKHVPQRTCIACRTHDAKRGLVRLVKTPEGAVELDESGKKNGRGAYLCRTKECWETGLGRKALDNALKMQIDPESRARLKSYGE